MKALKYLICILLISIGFNSCEQLNQSSPNENTEKLDWSEIDYAYFDMENYLEWDTGAITEDNTYLLIKADTLSNGYIGYLNNANIKNDGVALYFDENVMLTSFITQHGCCYIYWKSSNKADLQIITESSNEFFEDIILEVPQIMSTRAIFVPVILALARAASIAMTINSSVQCTKALLNGDLETAGKNALGLICGGLGGKVFKHYLDDILIDASFAGYEKLSDKIEKDAQSEYLNNCNVSLSTKKTSTNSYELTINVSEFETISAKNYKVLCGVAIRKWPHVTYFTNELKINEFYVDGNGTTTIEFEMPEASTYYAVPYLRAAGYIYIPPYHVRHGNVVKMEYFDGYIDEFKQISYTENKDTYTFKCYAHAICNTKDNQYWKLYYENKTGWKEFYSAKTYNEPSISATNNGEFEFDVELHASKFKDVNTKNIKLGIAKFDKNHYLLIASEPQIFELTIEDDRWVDLGLPSGILWAAYNVGATSPEEYGGYYAWGETEEKSSYTWENYKYLNSASESYINIGSNICGTTYDVAHMEWGEGARMPTHNEIKELLQYCSKNRTTEGFDFIGPNGNKINLPLAGGKEYTLFGTNEYAYYRSGSQYNDPDYYDEDDVYCLIFEDEWYIDPDQSRQYGFSIRPVKDKETGVENQ